MKVFLLTAIFLLISAPGFAYHADTGDAKILHYGGAPATPEVANHGDMSRDLPDSSSLGSEPKFVPAKSLPAH